MMFSLIELLLACAACSLATTFAMCCTILSRGTRPRDDDEPHAEP